MKPLLPLVAALAVPACSFPCDKSGSTPTGSMQVKSGTGYVLLTCPSTKKTTQLMFKETWTLFSSSSSDPSKSALNITLQFAPQNITSTLNLFFDSTLEDGTYAIGKESPVQGSLLSADKPEGTLSFSRTRNIPFLDTQEPEPGVYESSVDMTVELRASVLPDVVHMECPEYLEARLEPTTLHLEKTTTVGTCNAGDVLEGLSQAKGGGH